MNGKIFYIIGKSATGKDSLLSKILSDKGLGLQEIVQYTTRPIRDGETEGKEYHFVDEKKVSELEKAGKIIEKRIYHTVHGDWSYFMADDGAVDLNRFNYAAVGTVESYVKVRDYFNEERVIPIYIYVETGERLERALKRERNHDNPKYAEMCRRFLADEQDFSDEKLLEAGLMDSAGKVRNAMENKEFSQCLKQVKEFILSAEK